MGGCCYMDLGKAYWSIVGSDRIRTEVLDFCFDAFSSREPVSTSLESALTVPSFPDHRAFARGRARACLPIQHLDRCRTSSDQARGIRRAVERDADRHPLGEAHPVEGRVDVGKQVG